jgi:hypothetical protein
MAERLENLKWFPRMVLQNENVGWDFGLLLFVEEGTCYLWKDIQDEKKKKKQKGRNRL